MLKAAVKSALRSANLELRRIPPERDESESASAYRCCMEALLSFRESLTLVQVGANDGAINDPMYGFTRAHPERTRVLLVEPQTQLLPYLEANYAFHPNAEIFNGAVGPDESLTLYCVKEDYWDKVSVPYAKGWPAYRAPTGITSSNRAHVLNWLKAHLERDLDPEAAIDELRVECLALPALLSRFAFPAQIDVLQIDAEGFDDQVIYASDIAATRPHLINFEARESLSRARWQAVKSHLEGNGYHVSRHGGDALAVRAKV